jgi:hypothetical protein
MSLAKNEPHSAARAGAKQNDGEAVLLSLRNGVAPPDRHRTSSEVSDLSSARQAGVIPDISRSNKIDGRLVSIFDGL